MPVAKITCRLASKRLKQNQKSANIMKHSHNNRRTQHKINKIIGNYLGTIQNLKLEQNPYRDWPDHPIQVEDYFQSYELRCFRI